MFLGLGRTPQQGAITIINCAVNPALNSQQAVYYDSNCRPEQATDAARYSTVILKMELLLASFICIYAYGHKAIYLIGNAMLCWY